MTIPDTVEYTLERQIADLEAMLSKASETIGRIEHRWRSPKAERPEGEYLVIQCETLARRVALWRHGMWVTPTLEGTKVIVILAWAELLPIPADDVFKELV